MNRDSEFLCQVIYKLKFVYSFKPMDLRKKNRWKN